MLRFALLLVMISSSQVFFAQTSPSVGDKAPPISITDWLANVPANKNLEGRPIVIDFWATWCGPCIKAVPHFNELRSEFAANEELLFLSMSDEKPDKVNRSLKRIDFQSTVVTDHLGKTQEALQINAIPVTYLIDRAGIIQWIGSPEMLTADLIKQFLAGEPLSKDSTIEVTTEEEAPVSVEPSSEQDFSSVLALMKDKEVKYLFKFSQTKDPNALAINALPKAYFKMGTSLGAHLAELLEVGQARIAAPEGLLDPLYNISYINRGGIKKIEALAEIRMQLLRTLGLVLKREERTATVYQLEVINEDLLEQAEGEMSGVSDAGDQKVFTNQTTTTVLAELEKATGYLFEDKTGLTASYDFLLTQTDLAGLQKSLASYGLALKASERVMTFYQLSANDR